MSLPFAAAAFGALSVFAFAFVARAQSAPWLPDPVPLPIDRTPVRERGPAPEFYTSDGPTTRLGLRALAGGVRIAPSTGATAAFALDLGARVAFGLHRGPSQWMLFGETAYTLFSGGGPVEHTVGTGLGIGWGRVRPTRDAGVAWALIPRAVVGSARDGFAWGERMSLEVEWIGDAVSMHIALFHEVLTTHEGLVQDIGLVLGLGRGGVFVRDEATDAQ